MGSEQDEVEEVMMASVEMDEQEGTMPSPVRGEGCNGS